jgi:hypothetical protein
MIILLASSSLFAFCLCLLALLIYLITRDSNQALPSKEQGGGGSSTTPTKKTNLPVDTMLTKKKSPWNTQSIGNPERLSVKDGVLKLRYGKNAHGAPSGAKVSALPLGKFPAETLEFGYDVYFPDSFDWKKGGKLPGVCLGTSPKECATGGDWKKDEGSCRFMWRSKDGKNAYIIGYIYLPIEGHFKKSYDRQGAGYKKVTDPGNRTGHDLWHGELPIKKGWNSLRMKLKMNTPKKPNGSLEVTVNDKTVRVDDIVWRDSDKVKISNINFVSFYGGGSNDWNSPMHETYTQYKNIYIS